MADTTDLIELITTDHREVEQLFTRIESDGTPGDEKQRLLRRAADMLIAHSKAEEEVAYPAIRKAAPKEGDDVKDGVAEHHHIEEMLEQLLGMQLDDPGADGILAAVIAETRHHVEEEEEDILPQYRRNSDDAARAEVGRRFHEREQQELQRRRAGSSSPSDDLESMTKDELYERAKQQGVSGRSDMTKDELIRALRG